MLYPAALCSQLLVRDIIAIGRHCLRIPGKRLDVSILLDKKKFRSFNNKEGVLRGFKQLESDGLGKLEAKRSGRRSTKVRHKTKMVWIHMFILYMYYMSLKMNGIPTVCKFVYIAVKAMKKRPILNMSKYGIASIHFCRQCTYNVIL